jgi:asparagine synthase (glutamine-hydrolysing)
MCGIVGIFDTKSPRSVSRQLLERMNSSQYHRGPDEGGVHTEPGIGLGHRRLSIIDLSTGQQPLYNEDKSVVVVFNGEIYNFRELIPELLAAGHTFRTKSDTEVIVHSWEEWGEKCVERFRGMFAFALWDRNRETLFLARDRAGVKPLFYAFLPNGLMLFGSELKALVAHPDFERAIDAYALEDYFALGYIPEPRTIFRRAQKLPPAFTLSVKRGVVEIPEPKPYWDIRFTGANSISEGEATEELIFRLRDAVRVRLMSEVPLGAFLSGGVDSSAVVAMMAGLTQGAVNTCSISFGDAQYDESRYAQQVADRYHTNHRVRKVDPNDFGLIDTLAEIYDEPYADSSAIPTYRVCQLARESVTVALSGDGGDENFGGYRRYRWHLYEERMRSLLPLGVRRPLFGALGAMYPKADWAPKVLRAKSTFEGLARDSVEGYFHSVSLLSDSMRSELFSVNLKRELGGYRALDLFRTHAARAQTDDPLALVQYLDMKTYLVGDINTKVDRASMAHSLEVREPLMDHPLMEWLATLPSSLKVRDGQGKYLLKKSLEPHLASEILYRPKMGFAVPLAAWFRGPLRSKVQDAILGSHLADTGYFNQRYLKQLVENHQSGLRDHSAPLWSLLMFEAFLRRSITDTVAPSELEAMA